MLFWYGTPWFNPDPNVDAALTSGAVQQWLPDELISSQAVIDLEGSSFRSPVVFFDTGETEKLRPPV
jgi:hypothetical protein